MRDQETAEVGLRAAMTGHMVLSTLHTNDAMSTPIRLLDMGAPRYMVAMSLHLVIAQRLVRLVCESCTQAYTPLPGEHEWLRHELGERVDAHKYVRGRRLHAVQRHRLPGPHRRVRDAGDDPPGGRGRQRRRPPRVPGVARRQMSGHTLRRHATMLAAEGRTTLDEAMRVSSQYED